VIDDASLRTRAAAYFPDDSGALCLERYGFHLCDVANECALDGEWTAARKYRAEGLRCLELAAKVEVAA
jgi:hypothetical protein